MVSVSVVSSDIKLIGSGECECCELLPNFVIVSVSVVSCYLSW